MSVPAQTRCNVPCPGKPQALIFLVSGISKKRFLSSL
jgi:hypothetical protein